MADLIDVAGITRVQPTILETLGSALEKQQMAAEAMECYQKALETSNLRQDLSLFAKKRLGQL